VSDKLMNFNNSNNSVVGGASGYISNPNMEEEHLTNSPITSLNVSGDSKRPKVHEEQVKKVKNQLLNFVKEEPPSKSILTLKERSHTEHKKKKHTGMGAALGIQMSKQGLQFGNNSDVLKSMIGKKEPTQQ